MNKYDREQEMDNDWRHDREVMREHMKKMDDYYDHLHYLEEDFNRYHL